MKTTFFLHFRRNNFRALVDIPLQLNFDDWNPFGEIRSVAFENAVLEICENISDKDIQLPYTIEL